MTKRRGIRRFSIKTKLLTALLGVSLVSLVIFGFVAFNGIVALNDYSLQSSRSLGESAVTDSTIALETQAENYLLGLATDQADISNNLFEKVESELMVLSCLAKDLLSKASIESKPLFSQQQNPGGVDASVYYLSPNVTFENVGSELNYTSNMDAAFAAVHSNDQAITQLYVGTDSGIFQVYPWLNTIPPNFDPRVRGWYTTAQPDTVTWSTPYLDAGGHGLMVTCSIAIKAPEKGYSWVVAADVTLETLNRNIVNAQIEKLGGYSFMLDNEGNMITRSLSAETGGNGSILFIASSELLLGNTTFAEVATNMTKGLRGITMCTFGGGDNYVAYSPLKNANWSLAVVLPVSEVIAPALSTAARINDTESLVNQYINRHTDSVRNSYIALFVIILVLVIAVSYLLARMIVTPIVTLSKGAKAIGAGDFDSRVKVNTGDELEALANSFNTMADNLQEHIAELKRTTAEKERLVKELEIAKGIQQSFLPDKEPEIAGVDIAASNIPAKEVGGDFYDFIPIDNDQWGLTIADVSGKGVPAALFMALSRTLVRASTTGNPNIRDGIEKANDLICQDAKTGMFVTLFYAILDSKKKLLKYVNAGHNPPLLLRQPYGKTILLKADGIALGVMDGIHLEEAEVQLEKGDLLTLFTDGVTEAINDKEEQFGQDRLLRIVQENRMMPAKEIMRMVQEAVAAFSLGQPQFDDITLMIIKVL